MHRIAQDNRHEYDQVIQHIATLLQADPDNAILHHKLYEGHATETSLQVSATPLPAPPTPVT